MAIVTLDANGGTGVSPASFEVTLGELYAGLLTATAEKIGYSLVSWNLSADGTEGAVTAETEVTVEGDHTLYAQYVRVEYDIDYILNGGTGAEGNPGSYTVSSPTITILPPVREGYTFTGWEEGEGEIVAGSTGNKVFTALWEADTLRVTLDTQDGEDPTEEDVVFGEEFDLTVPVRVSYIFKGWFTAGGERITDALGDSLGVWNSLVGLTLYAYWEFNTAVSTPAGVGTVAEFLAIRRNLNRSFYLLRNINLEGITWEPIGDMRDPFTGNFDGKNFTVSGVSIAMVDTEDKMQYAGLFGCATGEIKDLNITGLDIVGSPLGFNKRAIGGIAGAVKKITGCTVSGKINIRYADHGRYTVGGVAGFVKDETSGCSSSAVVSILTADNVFADSVVVAGGVVGYTKELGNATGSGQLEGRNSSLGGIVLKMVIGGVAGAAYTVTAESTQSFTGGIALTGAEHRVHSAETVGIKGRKLWHI